MRISMLALAICLCATALHAQQSAPVKYGKISVADLEKKVYAIDSGASAVVLCDMGSTEIEGNTKGWFSYNFKHYKRVHILNKNGYYQASVEIPLYTSSDGSEEQLQNVKAVTYNLEGGKIVETKLDKSSIFKDKQSKNQVIKKFTLPNVKEGSIIEFEYTVTSEFLFNLQPWVFQGSAPRLWSEFKLSMPQFLSYVFLTQGYQPYYINEHKDRTDNFIVKDATTAAATESTSFSAGVTDYRWVMKDVPELKDESFTSTLANHVSKIEFQLASYAPPLTPHTVMGTWPDMAKRLLEDEEFGGALKTSGFLSDIVKPLLVGANTDLEKAQRIYAYVRDNITCTDHSGLYAHQSIKNVLKSKSGSVSEVNLMLTAMLRYAGLTAAPVILSTSDNGYTYAIYPIVSRFNYVVSEVIIGDDKIMLDASRPRLGFGKLTPECYNGHARTIDEQATPLELTAEQIKEQKLTSIYVANTDDGKWEGSVNETPGYYESYRIRDRVTEKGQDDYFKDVKKGFGVDVDINNISIDSLKQYEQPVAMHYSIDIKTDDNDLLYVNPMFGEGYKENPFKSDTRSYPVEMPFTSDETYLLTMQVPKGYVVDELPKGTKVKLNEAGDGYFEYLISQSGETISMRSRITLNKAVFAPEEYDYLREFFKLVVSKQSQQIVFKKKK